MDRSANRWIGVGLSCVIWMSAACREREPAPPHNRNLGGEGQYLLPTPAFDVGKELAGNRRVDIPERTKARDIVRPGKAGGAKKPGAEGAAPAGRAPGEKGKGKKGPISGLLDRLRGGQGSDTGPERPPNPEPEQP
ncbi:MAG: hypothetical protein V2A79_05730 [Planctomycetota bacterium]